MQAARHMNCVIVPYSLCGSVVEQWTGKSEGLRFDSSWGLRIFSLFHARDKMKKYLSPIQDFSEFLDQYRFLYYRTACFHLSLPPFNHDSFTYCSCAIKSFDIVRGHFHFTSHSLLHEKFYRRHFW